MNTLQNMFNNKPNANMKNNNIFMQLMSMNEEKRAETIAEILNKNGITSKEMLQNLIKNTKFKK